ncbi:alpha/beta hydrolase [Diplocloster modestus]|uniref:Esterase family protein n=1 Tax=Diplocloster modestus TaxID=2850322 RepID=A0ABS6KDQ8_9FIRM|nr:alpha/beta hydrolase family protein [Diplocloster modestus]MBU9728636.1 esterase family protein [Diplocloster modestus]
MTYLRATIHSWSLGVKTNVHVLIPDLGPGEKPPADGYAVLYLLHGYTGDGSDWLRLSRLEYYLMDRQIVVVMPDGNNGFYTDTAAGDLYWTYLSVELPLFITGNFPVSGKRAHTCAAGLSMGGYGALKLALRCPQQYGYAVSFSGMLDVLDMIEKCRENPNIIPHCSVTPNFKAIYGDTGKVAAENDLIQLLKNGKPESCPQLKLYCGEEDFLFGASELFAKTALQYGLPCSFEHFQGGHEWGFWDTALARALEWLLPYET